MELVTFIASRKVDSLAGRKGKKETLSFLVLYLLNVEPSDALSIFPEVKYIYIYIYIHTHTHTHTYICLESKNKPV